MSGRFKPGNHPAPDISCPGMKQLDLNDLRPRAVAVDEGERRHLLGQQAKREAYRILEQALTDALSLPNLPGPDRHRLGLLLEPVQELAHPLPAIGLRVRRSVLLN